MLTLGWVWQQMLWRALEKKALSLGLAPSPDSATELDDKHGPARSPTPRSRGMEPGPVQLPAKHRCCCTQMLGEVTKPEAWTQGGGPCTSLPSLGG